MMRFASSVQHITGQTADSATLVEEELEVLRAKVEELSEEVGQFHHGHRS